MPLRVKPRYLAKIARRVGHESDRFFKSLFVLSNLPFLFFIPIPIFRHLIAVQEHLTNTTEGTTTAEPNPQIL